MAGVAYRREVAQATTALTSAILFVIVAGVFYWARAIIIPLALAAFLAFILSPIVSRLQKIGLGRVLSVTIVVLLALAVVVFVGWVVTSQVNALVQELPEKQNSDRIVAKVATVNHLLAADPHSGLGKMFRDLEGVLRSPTASEAREPVPVILTTQRPSWLAGVWAVTGPVFEVLAQGAFTFILVVFLLLNREDMRNRVLRLIGPRRMTTTTKAMDDAGSRISRYLQMQLLINSMLGVVLAVALLIIGVPYAILWGFVAGLMRYVPYIGAWIGLAPPVLATMILSDGWREPLEVLATYVALELILNSVVEPRLLGHSLGMSEVAQIFSAAFWAFLWGPIGLVLSGPLTAVLLVLGKNVPQLGYLDVLLSVEEPLPPPDRFYQRLMARDRDEAREIATEYATARTPDATRDDLLIPALGRAQHAANENELSESDAEFVDYSVREIADELDLLPHELDQEVQTPDDERVHVLAVPADGAADSLALEFLAAKLDPKLWNIKVVSSSVLSSELLAQVKNFSPAIVVVGASAPCPIGHARYLCKRLRSSDPDLQVILTRWSIEPLPAKCLEDLTQVGVNEVLTNIPLTAQYLQSTRSPLMMSQEIASTGNGQANPAGAKSRV
ncbi:MAG: AI-2E family transporter [Gemmataceae bacterium]